MWFFFNIYSLWLFLLLQINKFLKIFVEIWLIFYHYQMLLPLRYKFLNVHFLFFIFILVGTVWFSFFNFRIAFQKFFRFFTQTNIFLFIIDYYTLHKNFLILTAILLTYNWFEITSYSIFQSHIICLRSNLILKSILFLLFNYIDERCLLFIILQLFVPQFQHFYKLFFALFIILIMLYFFLNVECNFLWTVDDLVIIEIALHLNVFIIPKIVNFNLIFDFIITLIFNFFFWVFHCFDYFYLLLLIVHNLFVVISFPFFNILVVV